MSDALVQESDVVEEIKDEWKVKLQNFQSIVSGEITIPKGICILTGDTNNGKTAFIRGIDYSMFNTGTDDIVKAGAKIAGVTISNGKHTMIYCRNSQGKNEKTAYQFDGGTVQKKVGRSQLPEVINMFGIRDVKMQNGIKMKLNFWYQNDKPFLMDKTSGQLYEFLSLSSCDKYVKVLKQMVVDIKVQEAEINNSNVRIDTLKAINNRKQEYIDKNEGFDDIYERTILASSEANLLNGNISQITSIQSISGEIKSTKDSFIKVSEKLDKIDSEGVSSRYNIFVELDGKYSEMYRVLCEVNLIQSSLKSTKESLKDVSDKYKSISKVDKSIGKMVKQLLSDIDKYSISFKLAYDCEKERSQLEGIKTRIISLESGSSNFESVESDYKKLISLHDEYKVLDLIIRDIKDLKSKIKSLTSNIKDSNERLKESEKELNELKMNIGYCPFCGSVFKECTH